jgi:hypothetical protein
MLKVGPGSRTEHIHAFNFGRSVGHLEQAREVAALRLRWVLLGVALGLALAAAYFQLLVDARTLWLK